MRCDKKQSLSPLPTNPVSNTSGFTTNPADEQTAIQIAENIKNQFKEFLPIAKIEEYFKILDNKIEVLS